MTITIPSPSTQLVDLENERLKLQFNRELLSSSTSFASFSEHCCMRTKRLHTSAEQGRLKELPPEVWWLILMQDPQTAVYCPCFSEFSGWEWFELLARFPQLAEFCEDFSIFLSDQITEIVLAQPQLLCRFPVESVDWIALLQQDADAFASLCPDWRFSAEKWGRLLEVSPQLRDYCDFKTWDKSTWNIVLQSAPHLFQECPSVSEWGTREWTELLIRQPQLAAYCQCWEKFSEAEWQELLSVQPRLISYCPNPKHPTIQAGFLAGSPESADWHKDWDCFSLHDWLIMLRNSHNFEPNFNRWGRFPVSYWWNLLFHQPDYAERCSVIDRFSKDDWQLLCRKHPVLKKYRS